MSLTSHQGTLLQDLDTKLSYLVSFIHAYLIVSPVKPDIGVLEILYFDKGISRSVINADLIGP